MRALNTLMLAILAICLVNSAIINTKTPTKKPTTINLKTKSANYYDVKYKHRGSANWDFLTFRCRNSG